MPVPASHLNFFWQSVVYPRLGDDYGWGASMLPDNLKQGTDCSGWVSVALSAVMRGPNLIYQRQFWTGTFADVRPGDHGPYAGIDDTKDLICVASLDQVPADAVMIIAIIQTGTDTSLADQAHMICSVRGVVTEEGGAPDNFHTSANPDCTPIDSSEFNQWLYLPGPVTLDAPDWTDPNLLASIGKNFAA